MSGVGGGDGKCAMANNNFGKKREILNKTCLVMRKETHIKFADVRRVTT